MVEQTGKEEMTLLITAGYGHESPIKVWFSLQFDHFNNDLNDAAFIDVVMNYGCDRSFAVKAASLLKSAVVMIVAFNMAGLIVDLTNYGHNFMPSG